MSYMFEESHATNPASVEILQILEAGSYVAGSGTTVSIGAEQEGAERDSRLFTPEALATMRVRDARHDTSPRVEVIAATTQQAAASVSVHTRAALLNFASARNPGGGFLGNAKAQEEDLCRCSGLYRTLIRHPEFYTSNREHRSLLYLDHLIYSPEVPFVRHSAHAPLLEVPFVASVITAPAPNAGAIQANRPQELDLIEATFARRWSNVLAVCARFQHPVVILGAWGCGAFRNDPTLVARTLQEALAGWGDVFEKVICAIPGSGKVSRANLAAFRAQFESPSR